MKDSDEKLDLQDHVATQHARGAGNGRGIIPLDRVGIDLKPGILFEREQALIQGRSDRVDWRRPVEGIGWCLEAALACDTDAWISRWVVFRCGLTMRAAATGGNFHDWFDIATACAAGTVDHATAQWHRYCQKQCGDAVK